MLAAAAAAAAAEPSLASDSAGRSPGFRSAPCRRRRHLVVGTRKEERRANEREREGVENDRERPTGRERETETESLGDRKIKNKKTERQKGDCEDGWRVRLAITPSVMRATDRQSRLRKRSAVAWTRSAMAMCEDWADCRCDAREKTNKQTESGCRQPKRNAGRSWRRKVCGKEGEGADGQRWLRFWEGGWEGRRGDREREGAIGGRTFSGTKQSVLGGRSERARQMRVACLAGDGCHCTFVRIVVSRGERAVDGLHKIRVPGSSNCLGRECSLLHVVITVYIFVFASGLRLPVGGAFPLGASAGLVLNPQERRRAQWRRKAKAAIGSRGVRSRSRVGV